MSATMTKETRCEIRPSVRLDIGPGALRELLISDLEYSGFDVRFGTWAGEPDVLVTDRRRSKSGGNLTVRLGTEITIEGPDGTWFFPATDVDKIADVLHAELTRSQEAA